MGSKETGAGVFIELELQPSAVGMETGRFHYPSWQQAQHSPAEKRLPRLPGLARLQREAGAKGLNGTLETPWARRGAGRCRARQPGRPVCTSTWLEVPEPDRAGSWYPAKVLADAKRIGDGELPATARDWTTSFSGAWTQLCIGLRGLQQAGQDAFSAGIQRPGSAPWLAGGEMCICTTALSRSGHTTAQRPLADTRPRPRLPLALEEMALNHPRPSERERRRLGKGRGRGENRPREDELGSDCTVPRAAANHRPAEVHSHAWRGGPWLIRTGAGTGGAGRRRPVAQS